MLICGLPGAGKTTIALRLEATMQGIRLCPDDWLADLWDGAARDRVETAMWDLTQRLLRTGVSVILEFGFWVREERDEKRTVARALGAAVELRYLDAPLDELQRRRPDVTAGQWATWWALFEPPDTGEQALFDPPPGRAGGGATAPSSAAG